MSRTVHTFRHRPARYIVLEGDIGVCRSRYLTLARFIAVLWWVVSRFDISVEDRGDAA